MSGHIHGWAHGVMDFSEVVRESRVPVSPRLHYSSEKEYRSVSSARAVSKALLPLTRCLTSSALDHTRLNKMSITNLAREIWLFKTRHLYKLHALLSRMRPTESPARRQSTALVPPPRTPPRTPPHALTLTSTTLAFTTLTSTWPERSPKAR